MNHQALKLLILTLVVTLFAACSQTSEPVRESASLTKQFIVDGVAYTPQEMDRFAGEALHYVANPDFHKYGILHAFTSWEAAQTFMAADLAKQASDPELEVLAPLNRSKFFKGTSYNGEVLKVNKGISHADLRTILDSNGNNFGNSISSMKCRTGKTTTLFDFENFGGGTFNCQGTNLPELTRAALGLPANAWEPNNDATSLSVSP